MGADTDCDESGLDQYWRRRALALAGALGVIGLLAWTCTGATGDEPAEKAAEATPIPKPPTAMPTVTVTARITRSPRPVRPIRRDGAACRAGDLVVDMTATRDAYAGTDRPQFKITMVNAGRGPCTFDVDSLDLRVTSGRDRIWSTARCDGGSSIQTLRRGVPFVRTVTWDRRRATDGCRGRRQNARPGTYVATLKAPRAGVRQQIFHLR